MEIRHHTEEDAIFIRLRSGQSSYTRKLDENRYVGHDAEDRLIWVSLLNVSDGVDLDMLEGKELQEASSFLEEHNLREFA